MYIKYRLNKIKWIKLIMNINIKYRLNKIKYIVEYKYKVQIK